MTSQAPRSVSGFPGEPGLPGSGAGSRLTGNFRRPARSRFRCSSAGGRLLALVTVLAALAAAGCTSSAAAPPAQLRLQVSQPVSLYDVPLDIRVTGLHPGDRVTLQLATRDGQWRAHATFAARQPVLDLAAAAPVSGGYRGVHAMGLFEALAPRRGPAGLRPSDPEVLTLTASAPGARPASVTLSRELTGPGVTCFRRTVARSGFYGLYCAPAPHAGTRPPVLVFGGSEGGLATAPAAELLASRGFPALALAYFGEPGLPDALHRIPLEYFARAARWLGSRPGADARRLAVFGDSRGSEAALLLGADFPGLIHAVIAGSPSSVTNPAVSPAHMLPVTAPAWTLHGKPLPVANPLGDPASALNPAAVIRVQKIRGPVLLLAGAADQLWPSPRYASAIMRTLGKDHDRYPHHEVVFRGAGHAAGAAFPYQVGTVTVATPARTLTLGGTMFANSAAETSAWQDVLAFLRRPGA